MRTTIIAAVIAALAVTASPALAAAPDEVERFSEPYGDSVDCSIAGFDFTLDFSGIQYWTVKTWLDETGEPARESFHIRFRETDVNTTTGKTVATHGSETEVWDYVAGVRTLTGAVFMGSDKGTFIHDSGRAVLDIETHEVLSVHGPHEGLFAGIDETVCAAVA